MTSEDFRTIEAGLAQSHAQMARLLGVSEVSVKRYATDAQPIPAHIAKLMIALHLMNKEQLQAKFARLLAKYHRDTDN